MIKTLDRDIIGIIVVVVLLALALVIISLIYDYTKTNKECPYGKMIGVKIYKDRDGNSYSEYLETNICKTKSPDEFLLEVSKFGIAE